MHQDTISVKAAQEERLQLLRLLREAPVEAPTEEDSKPSLFKIAKRS